MAILNIIQYPDLRLRQTGYLVDDARSPEIHSIIQSMKQTLRSLKNCAGLSATQLDLANPPRITVIDTNKQDNLLCLINPLIVEKTGETLEPEGCMSIFPNEIHAKVKRAKRILVKALNERGEKIKFYADGFLAKCIQHEYDHLHGILYLDYLDEAEKQIIEKNIIKLKR